MLKIMRKKKQVESYVSIWDLKRSSLVLYLFGLDMMTSSKMLGFGRAQHVTEPRKVRFGSSLDSNICELISKLSLRMSRLAAHQPTCTWAQRIVELRDVWLSPCLWSF